MKKRLTLHNFFPSVCSLFLYCIPIFLAAQEDSSKNAGRQSLINLQYHVKNNRIPYITIQTKNKLDKAFLPAANVQVSAYLDSDSSSDALIGKVFTNQKGEAILALPPKMASKWNGAASHSFLARTEASRDFDAQTQEVTVSLAKLELDTADSRSLVVRVLKKEGESWVPMPGVDIRIGVRRFGGNLNIGESDTYTTDSTGEASAEFKLEKLPGDKQTNLELVASIEDNDDIGNLETTLNVPWGTFPGSLSSDINKRTLWSRGTRAPQWLMTLAYGCILGVWTVIIYLITRMVKIKKLGVQPTSQKIAKANN